MFPPLFNRYEGGQSFGNHVDNAIRQVAGTAHRIRTDLSATLFLAEPDEYDGGELLVEDTYGVHTREAAGRRTWCSIPRRACTTSRRSRAARASPRSSGCRAWFATTGGARCCSTWTSRFNDCRADAPDHPSTVQLTGVYHNLLRQWAEL